MTQPLKTSPMQPLLVPATVTVPLNFPRKKVSLLASLQIMGGAVSVLCGVDTSVSYTKPSSFSYGIWGGMLFIITGLLCLLAAWRKSKCTVATAMVFASISVVFATTTMLPLTIVAVKRDIDAYIFNQRYKSGLDTNGTMASDLQLLVIIVLESYSMLPVIVFCSNATGFDMKTLYTVFRRRSVT